MSTYQTSAKTRRALIEATGQLAAEKGFNAVSTRAIAQLAGENIGSIHYHFGSKEKLFEAVIRSVATRWVDNPVDKALSGCDVTTPEGQAEAISRIIHREAALLFDKTKPPWHCRVIYQVMQYPNALQETFSALVLEPDNDCILGLLNNIDPEMGHEAAQLHFVVMLAPLFFHAEYQDVILRKLGPTDYSDPYLQRLVDTCIAQTLRLFNLPENRKREIP